MRPTPRSSIQATALAALAYLATFGLGIYISVVMLVKDVTSNANSSPVDELIFHVFLTGLGLLLGYSATQTLGKTWVLEWALGRRPRTPGSGLLSAGAALSALLLGYWTIGPFLSNTYTRVSEADGALAIAAVDAFVGAGVAEEFIVLALPVVLLRGIAPSMLRGRHFALILGALVCLRMAYHLYYGWFALTLLPCALVVSLVYLRWGQVWPLVIEHTLYNTALATIRAELLSREAALTLLSVVAGSCLITGSLLMSHHRKTAQPAGCSSGARGND